jgi:hypothetical protein
MKAIRRVFLSLSPLIAVAGALSFGDQATPVLLAILAISILAAVSYRLAPSPITRH